MQIKAIKASVVVVALAMAGCAQPGQDGPGNKQVLGTVGGAAVGGLVGSRFGKGGGKLAATAVGVFLGGVLGSEIGRSLDHADKIKAGHAMKQAQTAPIGETISWKNPENGHAGTVTPVREGTTSAGNYCREFQQTVSIGGKTERAYGTACRQPDGSWKIVS